MSADPYKRDRRIGRWIITRKEEASYVGYATLQLAIQRDAVLIDCRRDHIRNVTEWYGLCPHFEIVNDGYVVPLYRPRFGFDKEHGTRVRAWERVDG